MLFGVVIFVGSMFFVGCQIDMVVIVLVVVCLVDGKFVIWIVYVVLQFVCCMGVVLMECLQVCGSLGELWSLWYVGIEGFVYQFGYLYMFEVDEYCVVQLLVDGLLICWVFKCVVECCLVN